MDKVRKGEIAYLFIKHQLRRKGVRLDPNIRREIGNDAKALGVSVDEAMEFIEFVIRELVEEAFKKDTNKHN